MASSIYGIVRNVCVLTYGVMVGRLAAFIACTVLAHQGSVCVLTYGVMVGRLAAFIACTVLAYQGSVCAHLWCNGG